MTNRLLIVDDEPQSVAAIEAHLARSRDDGDSDYATESVACGADALAAVARARPDLVLLDLSLPDGSGLALLPKLRAATGAAGHLPVILMTTTAERDQRVRGLEAGADELLEKPFDGALLRARVRMLLQLRDSRDELRRSRDALRARNQELELMHREQRELIEFLVHDLKNPLMVVSGNLEFLGSSRGVPERLLGAVGDARDATERLRTLVQDLLTVSHLDHAQLPLRRETVDVASVVRTVVAAYARKAHERGITLTVAPSPPLRAPCDAGLLHRLLENIVDNSFRYTPAGGRIRAEMGDTKAPEGSVEVVISNSGPPIPKEQRTRIFEKFVRSTTTIGDPHHAVVAANVGIGLYFCKRVAEAHGGTIDVTETAEWPTAFVLRLPKA